MWAALEARYQEVGEEAQVETVPENIQSELEEALAMVRPTSRPPHPPARPCAICDAMIAGF
jgi:hypothetical protein